MRAIGHQQNRSSTQIGGRFLEGSSPALDSRQPVRSVLPGMGWARSSALPPVGNHETAACYTKRECFMVCCVGNRANLQTRPCWMRTLYDILFNTQFSFVPFQEIVTHDPTFMCSFVEWQCTPPRPLKNHSWSWIKTWFCPVHTFKNRWLLDVGFTPQQGES